MNQTLASELIYSRIVSVETQMHRAKEKGDQRRLAELESVRQAYVVDLKDVLNQESQFSNRRRGDKFNSLSLPDTEKWIENRRQGASGGSPSGKMNKAS